MYRELISSLTYMYSVICRSKGRAKDSDLRCIADGAHSLTATAPVAEQLSGREETANDKAYLREAQKIDEQIEEITIFLLSLEIV